TGPSVAAAATRASDAADVAIGRVVAALQQDADDLVRVAFDMTSTDEEAARRMSGSPEPRRSGAA
ncbi:MAG: hypothetical protein ABWX74_03095, partial [Aeromicrobium sp.]